VRFKTLFRPLEEIPADENAADLKKGLMDLDQALVTHMQPAIAMQPGQRALDDPPRPAQATAVGRAAFGEDRDDAAPAEVVAMTLRVVAAIALESTRPTHGGAGAAANGGQGIHQREQLGDIMPVGGGQTRDERNAGRVGQKVMFRSRLAAIGWVRSSFFPPRGARSEALSTIARCISTCPRRRNSLSNARWIRRHTPARCHAIKRRRQVLPEPQPISSGSMRQGRPLRSTNRMPANTARSGCGRRPARWPLPRRRFGISGPIWFHKASSTRRCDMADRTKSIGQVQEV